MTEAEWNACDDAERMLRFLQGRASERKMRLFACACSRRVLESRSRFEKDVQDALIMAESLADGLVTPERAMRVRREFESVSPYSEKWSAFSAVSAALDKQVDLAAESAARHSINHFGYSKKEHRSFLSRLFGLRQPASIKRHFQPSPILRDIFGNLFRPITLNSSWRSLAVVGLAESMYQERNFNRMRNLADALEQAGCTNADILNHCRQPGEHVRGCWVIDLLTGRQ